MKSEAEDMEDNFVKVIRELKASLTGTITWKALPEFEFQ